VRTNNILVQLYEMNISKYRRLFSKK